MTEENHENCECGNEHKEVPLRKRKSFKYSLKLLSPVEYILAALYFFFFVTSLLHKDYTVAVLSLYIVVLLMNKAGDAKLIRNLFELCDDYSEMLNSIILAIKERRKLVVKEIKADGTTEETVASDGNADTAK